MKSSLTIIKYVIGATQLTNELDTVKNKVYSLLRCDPATRENDNYLILKYWEYYDKFKGSIQKKLGGYSLGYALTLTPASSIFRARQLIQNEDKEFQPTSITASERRKKEDKIYSYCRKTSQKNIDE